MEQIPISPRVVLFVETSTTFGRKLLGGIGQYMRENEPWTVYVEPRSMYDSLSDWISNWHGSGILSRLVTEEQIRLVRGLGVPFVDLNETVASHGVPSVVNDNSAIGELAAEHFFELGLKHFAFVGYPGFLWSDQRGLAFSQQVQRRGGSCSSFTLPSGKDSHENPLDVARLNRCPPVTNDPSTPHSSQRYYRTAWENEREHLARWLKSLPRPVGLFACNDFRALSVLDACHAARILVPEQISVLGVDDEDIICDLCDPPLSSIVPNAKAIGYTAAALLDRLMKGESVSWEQKRIPPVRLIHRGSTEVLASSDPVVAEALSIIRRYASRGLSVEELVRRMCLSRSTLQRKFQNSLGRGMHEIITTAKIDRAKVLLTETNLSRLEIARRCGFEDENYFSVSFREMTGFSPRQWRLKNATGF